ncbi:uncharacterized protein LOC136089321 isoform X2 [Hydra vulgaris]|uniref:Uncharacterized protein LOC136089321 isoform X2 n=1 Tax=Hydra vulgaris TaxID=6087 RepID=A0ABM4DAH9_HYDVU
MNMYLGQEGSTDFFLFWFLGLKEFLEPVYFSSTVMRSISLHKRIWLKKGDVTLKINNINYEVKLNARGSEKDLKAKMKDLEKYASDGVSTDTIFKDDSAKLITEQSSADSDDSDQDWGLSADSSRVNKENALLADLEMQFGLATESTPAKKINLDAEDVIPKTKLKHTSAPLQSLHCLCKKTEHDVVPLSASSSSDIIAAINNQTKVLQESNSVLISIGKETNRLLRSIQQLHRETVNLLNNEGSANQATESDATFVDADGRSRRLDTLNRSNANSFAIEYVKCKFGSDYMSSHIFEPHGKADRNAVPDAAMQDLKEQLTRVFANYSWACVRRSLNQSGLDTKKKRKLSVMPL